jgi:hypothetical protein
MAVLDRLYMVLDPALKAFATQHNCTMAALFKKTIKWRGGGREWNACYCFNTSELKRLRKQAPATPSHCCAMVGGYLQVTLAPGVKEYAHRLICLMFNGPPPAEIPHHQAVVSHKCHNKACLNPIHLVWTDMKGNMSQPLAY